MAFSLTLKRTFEEVIGVSCSSTADQPEDSMAAACQIPVKRQKLQLSPRKLGLEYRELISVEGEPEGGDGADLLCAAVRQRQETEVPRLRLVTASPLMTPRSPPRTYREVFPKQEPMANPSTVSTQTATSFEKELRARACTDLTSLLGQPVVGSACLNMNIPDYQAAAAAAAILSTSPLRANDVPESFDDRSIGFSGRSLPLQLFQQQRFSLLKPGGSLCLWQTEDIACRNGFPDPRRLLDDSHLRRIGRHGSVGARPRLSDRAVSEVEMASVAEEETTIVPVEVCAECQKVFKRKVYLQRHMEREHWLPAKVFKCDDCKYETKHQSNLSVHRRTHTGERPYHCGACGQRYTQGHLLKSHIRSRHAGNLRFYNLDKRSDSTRGRKSLDFKHDIYLSLPKKDVVPCLGTVFAGPDASSMQAFASYQRERFASYLPRLPNPPLANWNLPARSKMRRESPSGGGGNYFALVPQRATTNAPLFLSTASGLPFFNHRSVNLSSEFPVFQTDLTQLLSTDKKPVYQSDEYDDQCLSSVIRLNGGSVSGGVSQPRFANDSLVNVKDEDLELFCERIPPPPSPQSFPEDLTVTRRRDLYQDDLPTPASPCVDGSASPDISNAVDVDYDGRRSPHLHLSLPTTKHINETNSDTNRMEPSEATAEEYNSCLQRSRHHPVAENISEVKSREPETNCDTKLEHVTRQQPEVTMIDDDDEVPKDLSIARRSLSTEVKDLTEDISVGRASSLAYTDSDDSSNSVVSTSSTSSDTPLPLEGRRPRRSHPPRQRERESATFDGSICPHFQKLQEFRRIVLRFVNAFAPNSLGISDKDESFAETDLIDEIVHAAMFNDV